MNILFPHSLLRVLLSAWVLVSCTSTLLAQSRSYYQHTPNGVTVFAPVAGKVSFTFRPESSRASRAEALQQARQLTAHEMVLGDNSPYATATLAPTRDQAATVLQALSQLPGVLRSLPVLRSPDGVEYIITERLMVQLRTPADLTLLQREAARLGCTVQQENPFKRGLYHLAATNGDGLTAANALMETGLFAWAQADMLSSGKLFTPPPPPTDPLYTKQWALKNTASSTQFYSINAATCATAGADMDVESAWTTTTGTGIKVAVLDQGVHLTHPDLSDNLLPGYSATIDGVTLYGPAGGAAAGVHGTWCAGLIGAEANNGEGIVGAAYGAKILPVRCFFNGYFFDSWAVNAIAWSWQNGADVLSCSWGGGGASYGINAAIHDAVTLGRGGKGCMVFFATGNSDDEVKYPASNPEVIAVGASTPTDERQRPAACTNMTYWGSSYGTGVDVMAPGTETITTHSLGYYNEFVGTSAACPNAAAIGALVLAANPALTGVQARRVLERSCERVRTDIYTYAANVEGQPNGTWNPEMGYGRVNATQAVAMATSLAFDLALYANHPHFVSCGTDIVPSFTVTNFGTSAISSFDIEYVYDGGAPVVVNQVVAIAAGASVVVTLPAIPSAVGTHTLAFQILPTTLNGAQTDGYTADNTLTGLSWKVLGPASLPFTEDFEANSLAAGYWETVNANNDIIQWETVPVEGKSGSFAARVNCSAYGVNGAREKLISRRFDLSGITAATLGFTYAYKYVDLGLDPGFNNYNDSLFIYVSTNCGTSWTQVYANGEDGSNAFSTAANGSDFFVPSAATDWCSSGVAGIPCVQLDISAYTGAGKDNVRFMFEVRNHFGNCLYIDDIEIRSTPTAALAGGGYACGSSSTWPPVTVAFSGPGPWNLTYSDGTNPHTVTGITTSPYQILPTGPGNFSLTSVSGPGGPGTVAPTAAIVDADPAEVNPEITLLPGAIARCEAGKEPFVNVFLNTAGNAVALDGASGQINLPAFNMAGNACLIEAWIYPETLTGRRSLLWEVNGSGDTLFHAFFRNNGNTLVWRVFSGGAYRETSAAVSSYIPLGTWSHVAFHFTTAPQIFTTSWFDLNLQIFINGTNRGATNFSGLTNLTGGTTFRVGRAGTGFSPFQGKIDEIRIWNKTLPEFTEMKLVYNRTLLHSTSLLARYYRCDEVSGTTLTDVTSAQHGSFSGGASRIASTASLLMDFEWFPASVLNLDNTRLSGQIVGGYTGPLRIVATNPYTACANYRTTTVVDMTAGVAGLAAASTNRTANAECTITTGPDLGWTHYYYYEAPATKEILLSVKKGANDIGSIGNAGFAVNAATTAAWGLGAGTQIVAPYVNNPDKWYVMNRYWKLTPTSQPTTDVEVRSYFSATDLADVNGSLSPDITIPDLRFYKINGSTDPNPDPDNNPVTLDGHASLNAAPAYNAPGYWEYVSTSYTPSLGPLQTWTPGTAFSNHYAQFTVASFSGGGGGGGGGGSGAFLPVNFLGLQATALPQAAGWSVALEWTVADEHQVLLYGVERRQPNGNWQEVAQVAANGGPIYTAQDNHVFTRGQRVQYRIRALDTDGAVVVSEVVEVISGERHALGIACSNPARPGNSLVVSSPDTESAEFVWMDQAGRTLGVPVRGALAPGAPLLLEVPEFAPGVYLLKVSGQINAAMARIVIE